MTITAPPSKVAPNEIVKANTSEDAVRTAVRKAASLGAVSLLTPGLDKVGMGKIWFTMVTTIARREGAELSAKTATKFVATAVTSLSAYSMGSTILSWSLILIMQAIPFATIPAAMATKSALNALFTYKLGKACIKRFSDPRLSAQDAISTGANLVMIPTFSEIREIKALLAGR